MAHGRIRNSQQKQLVDTVHVDDQTARTAKAVAIWTRCQPLRGTLAYRYLVGRCGDLPYDLVDHPDLRFDPDGLWTITEGEARRVVRYPTLVALMRDVLTGEPKAIHRTALDRFGKGKAILPDGSNSKRMFGPSGGAVVMLSPFDEVDLGLGIAEGIETSVSIIARYGWRPIWAAGSAGAISTFPVLRAINSLTVFADEDENGRGQEAADTCSERQLAGGLREVRIIKPPIGDWNDTARKAAV